MLTADEESCRTRLEEWRDRFHAILDLYPRSGLVSVRQQQEIRTEYADLKRALQEEHRVLASGRRALPLTAAETQWYQPVVHEAFIHLSARTNDTADKIHASLYDAYTDVEHMLSQLVP